MSKKTFDRIDRIEQKIEELRLANPKWNDDRKNI